MDTNPVPTLSRRRTLQGIAWATPALIVATAVPAAACSANTGCNDPSYCDGTVKHHGDGDKRDCDATVTRSPGSDDANYCITGLTVHFTSKEEPSGDCVSGLSSGWGSSRPTSSRNGDTYTCSVEITPSTGSYELRDGKEACTVSWNVKGDDIKAVECSGYSQVDVGKITMPTKSLDCQER